MVQHFGLQGLDDMSVHALGYQDLHESVTPAAAANAVREIAANNPDSAHTIWKQIYKQYLTPLFGGRSLGQPHLYELSTGHSDQLEIEQDGDPPDHILEMQTSGFGHVQSGLSSVEADVEAYQPPSDAAVSPTYRGLLGRTSNGLPHGNAEDTWALKSMPKAVCQCKHMRQYTGHMLLKSQSLNVSMLLSCLQQLCSQLS